MEKREVIRQGHLRHPHLGTSPGPQDLRAQQLRRSLTARSSHRVQHLLRPDCSGHVCGNRGESGKARRRARTQDVAVADSLEEQGASSPGTISQWAGGLEGEVSGTLWREGSRYMATVEGREREEQGRRIRHIGSQEEAEL